MVEFYVPGLMFGDRVIPEFWLAPDIKYEINTNCRPSVAEYNRQMMLPTLAELRHAFFGGSEIYRRSVLSTRGRGELTSTFLRDGKEVIERPENVVYRNGVWILEGGKVTPVELPPNGLTTEYDKLTGFPSSTSMNVEDAVSVFGSDTSYFYATRSGVVAVVRANVLTYGGPFYVYAFYEPNSWDPYIGGRECYRKTDATG